MGAAAAALDFSQAELQQPTWAPIGAFFFLAIMRLGLLQVFSPQNRSGMAPALSVAGAMLGAVVFGVFVHLALMANLQRKILETVNLRLEGEMLERSRAEEEVHAANERLEQRVEQRTRALETVNEKLRQEIVQRERVEEDLRRQKELLETIVDHVPLMLKFADQEGRVQMVNREWERILGRAWEEIENQSAEFYEEGYPDPRERQRVANFVARSNGEWADFKTKVRDGRVIDTSWAMVRLSDGATIWPGTGYISARKQAEQDLRKQKEFLQTIFDHLPVMINFVDEHLQLQLVNREWERTLGWSLEEIRQQNIDIVVENYPDPEYRKRVSGISSRIPPRSGTILRPTVRDGRVIDTSWAMLRLSDGTGIGIGQDITTRKRAEEALRESDERFRQLAENIHDLFLDQDLGFQARSIPESGV